MLDISRLLSISLLSKNGWIPEHKMDIEKRYIQLKNDQYAPQVPIKEVFQAARDIIETLDGIVIKNLHPKLGLGDICNTIEFNFFEYDTSNYSELLSIQSLIEKRVLFIGIGYDIIGDWLVNENGAIYFRNKIRNRLHLVSKNIYQFLKQDIYKLTDINGESIFSQ